MILCSRAKCGCMASALLCGSGAHDELTTKDIQEFIEQEEREGNIAAWEDRETVWAERCPTHEAEYTKAHPEHKPIKVGINE